MYGQGSPRVSVVVVTCGDEAVTSACLASIAESRFAPLELVVVNNGAGPRMQKALERFAERVAVRRITMRLISQARRVGACTARNLALPWVTGRFTAFLDNDVLCPDPLWIRRLVGLLESDERIGAVGPRIVCRATGRLECAGYAVSPQGDVLPLGRNASAWHPAWRVRREVQALGNFMALTDRVVEAGGFDPAFDPFGFENIDCCYRIKRSGLRVVCDGGTDLVHVGHVTTGRFERQGRDVLFEKSLLLRKRWRHVFAREAELFKRLTASGVRAAMGGAFR